MDKGGGKESKGEEAGCGEKERVGRGKGRVVMTVNKIKSYFFLLYIYSFYLSHFLFCFLVFLLSHFLNVLLYTLFLFFICQFFFMFGDCISSFFFLKLQRR